MRNLLRNQRGFTLIELVVVVAILGILAAVITPRVMKAMDNARDKSAIATGKSIQLALERYLIDNGAYPTEKDFDGNDINDNKITVDQLITLLGGYLTLSADEFDTDAEVQYTTTGPDPYKLTFTLKESNRTVTVTPTEVTAQEPTP